MTFVANWPLGPELDDIDLQSSPSSLLPSPLIGNTPILKHSASLIEPSKAASMAVPRYHVRTSSLVSNGTIQHSPPPKIIRMDSFDIIHGLHPYDADVARNNKKIDNNDDDDDVFRVPAPAVDSEWQEDLDYEEVECSSSRSRSNSSTSQKSTNSATVAWSELERAEETEAREEGADEGTAFLLARLEQENNALATDPRFGLRRARSRKQSRPPSIQMLKRLVQDTNNASARHSLPPNPPPMTELEFWAALVQDYSQTVQRLPTLTSNKIKAGVPPPLRGVVWVSMAGARDSDLAMEFRRLVQHPSPYENLIGKDVGRSFPGVEMFKDSEGEGQQMLGRVLKCFSLYDEEIGYCQGLGFLVGPLLMHMDDKDAFCVLVRLMENYDLRSCFMPSLSGLHVRVFQFQRLLDQHLPELAAHLASLQVEAAYLAQWFLSFFAVTCPLPMLFRIYDVIFAEGASETIMRVALSLMRRNQIKLMALTEFDEVMHILLSRALWDTYSCNADDFVNDFMGMTGVVTRESLQRLVTEFKDTHGTDSSAWFTFLPDATNAASKFLGRLWTSNAPAKMGGLSPAPAAGLRPRSFLRRSASKQSFASIQDSAIDGIDHAETMKGTLPGSLSMSVPGAMSKEDKDLHTQIEDLLTALGDLQRQNALLSADLQREREERSEDHRAFESLVGELSTSRSRNKRVDKRQTVPYPPAVPLSMNHLEPAFDHVLATANERLSARRRHHRQSSNYETKQGLRESLNRTRDQLEIEIARSSSLAREVEEQQQETNKAREQLREAQSRIQDNFKEKQKLERNIHEVQQRARSRSSVTWSEPETPPIPTIWRSDTSDSRLSLASTSGSTGSISGLREFKLGRPPSGGATSVLNNSSHLNPVTGIPRRTTSLATQAILATEDHAPVDEDSLLLELVNAKTAEAVARQELEEVKGKLNAMRAMLGVPSATSPTSSSTLLTNHKPMPSDGTLAAMMTPLKQSSGNESKVTTPSTGGFWGWGKKTASVSSVAIADKA